MEGLGVLLKGRFPLHKTQIDLQHAGLEQVLVPEPSPRTAAPPGGLLCS